MRTPALVSSLLLFASITPVHAQAPNYGSRVAALERTVFVAEPANIARSGIIYVYASQDGRWVETGRLSAADAAPGDRFGTALAAHGNTVIAARINDIDARGTVFVFEQRNNTWQQTARLTVPEAGAQDNVGAALAIHADVAVFGAPGTAESAGAVYIFRRAQDGRWVQEARLSASDAQPGDRFGATVAVSNDRLLVGAPAQAKARGGGYLFMRDASGTWRERSRLVARTVKEGDRLGSAVALVKEWAVVSAPGRDENTGAVYLFEPVPDEPRWAAYTRLFPYEASSQSQFGTTLAVVGDELWVGSPGSDRFNGTIFRFQWDPDSRDWTHTRKLSYVEGQGGLGFAAAVAVNGNTAVSGLPGADFGEGAALVFERSAAGEWTPRTKIFAEPESFASVTGKAVPCSAGKSVAFECSNVELLGFLPLKAIGGKRGIQLSSLWGWTDPQSGREYALVGRMDATAFVDVTNPTNPVYLGELPLTEGASPNAWREIKVYKDHAYIVADGAGKHGMQVFDLTQLRNVRNAPETFKPTTTYDRIFSAHNIVINEDKGFAFATGSNGGGEICGGGLHMIDIREPKKPKFAGCFADPLTGIQRTGYSHDAQCVTYKGPDEKYRGREICFGSNETALSIADVTDKAKPLAISRASYPNVQYSHQGWLTEDHRYFYMNDEGDEPSGVVTRTRTIIWDLTDLDDPQVFGEFFSPTSAVDHNLYIKGDTMYQSHYVAGLRIVDISDRKNPKEIGFFDSVPNSTNSPIFAGSWSNYPYFKSGTIIFTSMKEGLFVVRAQKPVF
ncbi:MAG: choice-of-anchor B family protein [Longimicrobiales bacterium]